MDVRGRLVVSDQGNSRVQAFWGNGSLSYTASSVGSGEDELWHPLGLAINNNNGHIIIADYGNHRLQVFEHIVLNV